MPKTVVGTIPTATIEPLRAPTACLDERPAIFSPELAIRLEETLLVVSPFQVEAYGQRFVHRETLRIDLRSIEADTYRVLAVQNFWVEDENPNLAESLAGVFLARRLGDDRWEQPEHWPIECRSLAILAYVDASTFEFVPSIRY